MLPQVGQEQLTEEILQFIHETNFLKQRQITAIVLLNLAQQMLAPISGLQFSQHSSTALITDMKIFKNMLNRICPQIRR